MERDLVETFERYDLDHRFISDAEGFESYVARQRDELITLERALRSLEVSHAVSNISSLEERANALRTEADQAAREVEQSRAAVENAQTIEKNVRRVTAEIIDERLALISPLLNELYERLRPHADWRTIEYSVRGDIKRFLTLRVGDGLNPQFVFSSGQRRAVGLAFLLSVYLARGWTRWNTLVLDDPVQHIDDFRALHLAEVFSAVRATGRQIVCAVEDSALADLLCRRLSSGAGQEGVRYEIEPAANGIAEIRRSEIPPMPTGVLRRGANLKTAG
jgi:chromosome segregation protein